MPGRCIRPAKSFTRLRKTKTCYSLSATTQSDGKSLSTVKLLDQSEAGEGSCSGLLLLRTNHTAKQISPPPYKCAAEERSPRNITPHSTPKGGIRKATVSERTGPISAIKRKYRMYAHGVQMKPSATSAIIPLGYPNSPVGLLRVRFRKTVRETASRQFDCQKLRVRV